MEFYLVCNSVSKLIMYILPALKLSDFKYLITRKSGGIFIMAIKLITSISWNWTFSLILCSYHHFNRRSIGMGHGPWALACWIAGSNPAWGIDVSPWFFNVVLSRVGKGHATGWSLVQGDLPYVVKYGYETELKYWRIKMIVIILINIISTRLCIVSSV
jgi:hypothetical protein